MRKVMFVVEMLRWGSREDHSYVSGIFENETEALVDAVHHMEFRGGKYSAEITGLDAGNETVYRRILHGFEDLQNSSAHLASIVRSRVDAINGAREEEDKEKAEKKDEKSSKT